LNKYIEYKKPMFIQGNMEKSIRVLNLIVNLKILDVLSNLYRNKHKKYFYYF